MEDVVIVPDCHCRDFYKPILEIKDKKIVFLGDYLDPYEFEGFSFEHGLVNLEEIIQFKKDNLERVTLLLGNHDCNSLWQENWASRFTPSVKAFNLYKDNLNLFEPYKIIDDIFFTHAGVCEGWYNTHSIKNIKSFLDKQWDEFLKFPFEESYLAIFDCGSIRWGLQPYGGPLWHDVSESYENNPIDYVQIFGHTYLRQKGYAFQSNINGKPMYCCDSRAIFIYSNNKLTQYEN